MPDWSKVVVMSGEPLKMESLCVYHGDGQYTRQDIYNTSVKTMK